MATPQPNPQAESQVGSSIKTVVDTGEQIMRLLRDGALGALFVLLVCFPDYLGNRISKAGFTKIEHGGITWEKPVETANEQTKSAAANISGASLNITNVSTSLAQVASQAKDPAVRSAIQQSIATLHTTLGDVTQADHNLQETVLTQQDLLAQSSTAPSTTQQGWLYIGEVTEDKLQWVAGSPKSILPIALPISTGQSVTASGLSYLRGESTTKEHKDGSVASVIRDRTKLRIEAIDPSHALGGGWFLWLKVVAQ